MGTLYSVNFKRKKLITRYDAKGRVIDSTEEWIDETIHDLPLATARHYVSKVGASITANYDHPHEGKAAARGRVKFEYQKDDMPVREIKPKAKRAAAPVPETHEPADYADLVNTLMEKSA